MKGLLKSERIIKGGSIYGQDKVGIWVGRRRIPGHYVGGHPAREQNWKNVSTIQEIASIVTFTWQKATAVSMRGGAADPKHPSPCTHRKHRWFLLCVFCRPDSPFPPAHLPWGPATADLLSEDQSTPQVIWGNTSQMHVCRWIEMLPCAPCLSQVLKPMKNAQVREERGRHHEHICGVSHIRQHDSNRCTIYSVSASFQVLLPYWKSSDVMWDFKTKLKIAV